MMKNKKILITVSESSIARNILRSFVLEKILAVPGTEVLLLAPQKKADWYGREFGGARVQVAVWSGRLSLFTRALSFLSRNGILTKTVLTDQATHLLFSKNYPIFILKRLIAYGLGRSRLFHAFVRWLASFRATQAELAGIFKEYQPDILFATDILDEMDLDCMSAAKRQRVKTVGMVRSWDNLTSGGLVQIVPDMLLLWNPYLYKKAVDVQHISPSIIKMTGIPHFDWYVRKDLIISREEFLKRFKLNPEKKFILFAGIGTFLTPHEHEVAEVLSEILSDGKIKHDAAIVFRPHPHFSVKKEKIQALGNIIYDDFVAQYANKDRSSWEMDQEHIIHYVNSLFHADLVITTASTVTMDAVSFEKPVICVAFDGKSKEPYWNSVLRFYRNYTHYIDISKTQGFKVAYRPEEIPRYINEYLSNHRIDEEGRKRIMQEFIWKLDGHSADRVAAILLGNPDTESGVL